MEMIREVVIRVSSMCVLCRVVVVLCSLLAVVRIILSVGMV